MKSKFRKYLTLQEGGIYRSFDTIPYDREALVALACPARMGHGRRIGLIQGAYDWTLFAWQALDSVEPPTSQSPQT